MLKKVLVIALILLMLPMDCSALSARSYALVEQTTGRLLEGQNIHQRLPMASTTKIMTGLLACESGKFDMVVTVPAEAIRVEGSSIYLMAGEKLTLRDLTYGLLLESGNDAANTIAFALAGSIENFAERMNEKAAELGLTDTHFENPSGLDGPEHYTSALDLARLGAYAMQNNDFRQIVSTYKARIPYNGTKDARQLVNHNELLKQYSGAIGIKTGFTKKSGRCLVSCAERSGVTVVAATLNGRDDWNDHIALLNDGFSILKLRNLSTGCPAVTADIVGGTADRIKCSVRDDLEAALSDDEASQVEIKLYMRKFIHAPVIEGQKIGEIEFRLGKIVLARTDILAREAVEQVNPKKLLSRPSS